MSEIPINTNPNGMGVLADAVKSIFSGAKKGVKSIQDTKKDVATAQEEAAKGPSKTDHFATGAAHGVDLTAALHQSLAQSHELAMKRLEHRNAKDMLTHTATTMSGIESKPGTRRRITTGSTTIEHVVPAAKKAPKAATPRPKPATAAKPAGVPNRAPKIGK